MGAINKIIYFTYSTFDDRDYERWGVNFLKNAGFDVEVWEFTPFLFPNVYKNREIAATLKDELYLIFHKKKDACNAIMNIPQDVFIICLAHYSLNSYKIYRALSKRKLKYAVFVALAIALAPSINNNFIYKLRKLNHLTINKVMQYLFNKCPHSLLGVRPASLILAGGENSLSSYRYPIDSKTDILWGHSFDYDLFLKEKDICHIKNDRITGVFLDEYLPFHEDFKYLGMLPPITKEEYYPLMCRVFEFFEKKYGAKIIIAAHPSSEYDKHPDYFEGREVIKGKTSELVKNGDFVIVNMSLAFDFAVLYYKPIVFITFDTFNKNYIGPYIDHIASFLGKKPINANQALPFELKDELNVNVTLYDNYKNAYIKKKGSKELIFWQIFADKIKGYH